MKLVAFVLAITLPACSFFATSAPKAPPDPPSCSESYASPLLDVFGAVVGGPMSGLIAWLATHNDSRSTRDTAIGATIGTTMLVFTVSAIVGVSRVSRCKDAQGAYRGEMMLRGQQPYFAPPVYAPPPVHVPPEPPPGTERGLCRADQTCDAGLVCASNRCVVLPAQ